uniref:Mitochondrial import inner membrane translocase subunit n=1 Tax=Marmota marmota marmota TaxID=9994 RepID=A0A8C5ZUJ9_MARMA
GTVTVTSRFGGSTSATRKPSLLGAVEPLHTRPEPSLASSPRPQKCIAMCMDRYMDAWNTVSRAYNSRLQRERANM